jgi:hypothetical protein
MTKKNPKKDKVRQRPCRFTDAEWNHIRESAQKCNVSASVFVRHCVKSFGRVQFPIDIRF